MKSRVIWQRTIAAALALPLVFAASAMSAQAQGVVVRSSGPSAASYPSGQRLPANATMTLRSGDQVTVLDRAGTRVLRGPGTVTLDGRVLRDRDRTQTLIRALRNPPSVRAGAVRSGAADGAPGKRLPPSIWFVDIARGGKICLPEGSDGYMWRENTASRQIMWLNDAAGGSMVRMVWPALTAGVSWPSSMVALEGGRSYRLTDDADATRTVTIDVVTLANQPIPEDPSELGVLLLDNGCRAQFENLADTIAAEDAAPVPSVGGS